MGWSELVKCPHCGMEITAARLPLHVSVCDSEPTMRARVLEAMTSTVPGVSVHYREYEARAAMNGLPKLKTLQGRHGQKWSEIVAAFGLVPPRRRWLTAAQKAGEEAVSYEAADDVEAVAIADVDTMTAEARYTLAHEYTRGLAVYKPHPARGGGVGYWVR